jgi:hypothetical protein
MIISGPFRLTADVGPIMAKHGTNWLVAWMVPIGIGGLFLLLLAEANPLIESWFTRVDTSNWKNLDLGRPLFWFLVVALIYPFLWLRLDGKPTVQDVLVALDVQSAPADRQRAETTGPWTGGPEATRPETTAGSLFGKTAILRSFILFNALFAVQTVLDLAYLWGGVALPAGMSYATYAHRGAYPLIITALLAGAFVLVAMQPATAIERSRLIRALVFIWISQNVLLVLSSMFRLNLYVDVYSLTGWRCAAFIWMLLVAVGLVLIVARIALDRPNSWLLWRNVVALVLTLYVCSLVDFPSLIAQFNVMHSREMSGTGEPIDIAYLCGLGPTALPAIDTLAARDSRVTRVEVDCRKHLAMSARAHMDDWRAWSFRGYRLLRYLDDSKAARY